MTRLFPLTQVWLAWVMASILILEITTGSNGLGRWLWEGLMVRDFTMVMTCIYLVSLMVLVGNFVIGLLFLFTSHGSVPSGPPVASQTSLPIHDLQTATKAIGISSFWSEYRKSVVGVFALIAVVASLVIALLAPFLATVADPNDPANWEMPPSPIPPFSSNPGAEFSHPLGTDSYGRDTYSMTLLGARSFIGAAFGIIAISLLIGTVMWIVSASVARASRPLARVGAAICTIVADTFIAIPLMALVVMRLCVTGLDGSLLTFLGVGITIFSWASLTKTVIGRLSSQGETAPSELTGGAAGAQRSELSIKGLLNGLTVSLDAAKFLVVIGLLSLIAIEFMGFGDPDTISWGSMMEFAWERSEPMIGVWWTWTFPMLSVIFVTASLYLLLDSIATALRRMAALAEPVPADQISSSSSSLQAP